MQQAEATTSVALVTTALFAVLEAASAAAHDRGRDVGELRVEMLQRRENPDNGAAQRLHRVARSALGWRMGPKVGAASLGVGAAAGAALTWDLAGHGERHTKDFRGALVRPWLSVRPLPDALTSD